MILTLPTIRADCVAAVRPEQRYYVVLAMCLANETAIVELAQITKMLQASDTDPSPSRTRSEQFGLRYPQLQDAARRCFATLVEASIFDTHRADGGGYTHCCTQMVHVLTHGVGVWELDPLQLVKTKTMDLLQGTMIHKISQQLENHEEKFKLMLQDRFEDLQKATEGQDDLITCHKCKSSNVIYNMRQTRSADEGMSAFLCCLKCGANWKM